MTLFCVYHHRGKCAVLCTSRTFCIIREVKHDVYGKRQTAKMKLLPSLFGCLYSRVKLFVFAMNSRRSYSAFVCFIYGLEEKNSKTKVIFAVCRLPLTSCLTSLLIRCLTWETGQNSEYYMKPNKVYSNVHG